jgi:F420-non-reducing hydrogenase iron-sulfur subunit
MSEKAIIFFCEWSSYPGLQLSENLVAENGSGPKKMVSMCGGRISPELIMESFSRGASGVLLACCPPEECEHDGNYKTWRRLLLLKKTLKQFGIDPERLRLEWVSKGDTGAFKKATDNFVAKINELGPM